MVTALSVDQRQKEPNGLSTEECINKAYHLASRRKGMAGQGSTSILLPLEMLNLKDHKFRANLGKIPFSKKKCVENVKKDDLRH